MSNLGLLKKVAIFKDLTDEELKTIDGMLVERYYKKGCLILKQGMLLMQCSWLRKAI